MQKLITYAIVIIAMSPLVSSCQVAPNTSLANSAKNPDSLCLMTSDKSMTLELNSNWSQLDVSGFGVYKRTATNETDMGNDGPHEYQHIYKNVDNSSSAIFTSQGVPLYLDLIDENKNRESYSILTITCTDSE